MALQRNSSMQSISALVPAAGIGQRMQSAKPKQYLMLGESTVIEHTLRVLLRQPRIQKIIVVLHPQDATFATLPIALHPQIQVASGGLHRVDSVLAGLQQITAHWVVVHDAVRPCLPAQDLLRLLEVSNQCEVGAILASPVRDTLKQSQDNRTVSHTLQRRQLWHALTPQLFPTELLKICLYKALAAEIEISDEATALEFCGYSPQLVQGQICNIKITYPEDLAYAARLLVSSEGNYERDQRVESG